MSKNNKILLVLEIRRTIELDKWKYICYNDLLSLIIDNRKPNRIELVAH